MYEVFFDLETKSFFSDSNTSDPSKLGVSIVSILKREADSAQNHENEQILSFFEKDFEQMWSIFRNAKRIIGFNTLGFDVPALSVYAPKDFKDLPHFDIYQSIKSSNDGRASSLNSIAKDTLGQSKVDNPENAILYWQKGDSESLALLQKYCEADVYLTKEIYDFGLKNKYLKFTDRWNNKRQVSIDFSYPASPTSIQTALF